VYLENIEGIDKQGAVLPYISSSWDMWESAKKG
jgi:hypothetical protein